MRSSYRFRHLAVGTWEIEFLSNPDYSNWLDSAFATRPLASGEPLVDYVRTRINAAKNGTSGAPASSTAPSLAQQVYAAPALVINGHGGVNGAPATGGNDFFSDMLDLSSYTADEGDGSSPFAGLDNSAFASTSASSLGVAVPASTAYAPYTLPSTSAPTSAPRFPSPFSQPTPSHSYPAPITPFTPPTDPRSAYFSNVVNPSFFGAAAVPSSSSTLALQSELIQSERDRRNAGTGTIGGEGSPPAFFDPRHQHQTISPAVLSGPSTSAREALPVASTSKSASAGPIASTSTSRKPPSSSSSSATSSKSRASPAPATTSDTSDWRKHAPEVRAHLSSTRLQRAALSTAQKLLKSLRELSHQGGALSTLSPWADGSDVPPDGRAEILTALLKFGGDEFWQAWLKEGEGKGKGRSDGLDLLVVWFEGANGSYFKKEDKDKERGKGASEGETEKKRKEVEQKTLALVLQALGKLPLTIEHLRHLSGLDIPKRARKISLKATDGAVKAAATQLVQKWAKVQQDYVASQPKPATSSKDGKDGATKRKAEAAEAPAKKAKVSTSTVKKPASVTTPAAPAYASTNHVKAALPSFKKAKSTAPAPAAPAAHTSALRAALAGLGKKDVGGATIPGGLTNKSTKINDGAPGAKGRKEKKSVRWREDDELEQVKYIERAVYEDEQNGEAASARIGEGEDAMENFRIMELQEGMSHTMHLEEEDEMEEEIDWYEPVEIVIPDTMDFAALREPPVSAEAEIQTQRESTLMAVDPISMPPDSPGEPPEYAPSEPDPEPKLIPLSEELQRDDRVLAEIAHAQASTVPLGGFVANDQIESLLGQLNASGAAAAIQQMQQVHSTPMAVSQPPQPPVGGTPAEIDENTLAALRSYDPAQIEAILRSNPLFQGLSLEALGLPQGPSHQMPPQPPHSTPYGQPWGQPSYAPPSSAWPAQPNPAAAYNGYVPPSSSGSVGYGPPAAVAAPMPNKGHLKKGKKKTVSCKFFNTPRGCDWGERCNFLHDRNLA
ncbi:hypothetical protein JCM1841_003308 [Sporobolomyces salmonicolor]